MKISVVLTPTEAKKFMAKTLVSKHEGLKSAIEKGHIIMHPSTTTLFIYEELTGKQPDGLWFVGAVSPWGNCISGAFEEIAAAREKGFDHNNVKYAWFFKQGKLVKDITLGESYEYMGRGDYYLKGVNAVDAQGNVGILAANHDGGTLSRAKKQAEERGFKIILLSTMNKMIGVSIEEAAEAAAGLDWTMGVNACIYKITAGDLFNEIQAFSQYGIKATPVASGGVNEADGATVFVLEGEQEQLESCLHAIDKCKGASLSCKLSSCQRCRYAKCPYSLVNKNKKHAFDWLTLNWYE